MRIPGVPESIIRIMDGRSDSLAGMFVSAIAMAADASGGKGRLQLLLWGLLMLWWLVCQCLLLLVKL